ncbi:MAG TPA: serine/threonine-protein kinase [Planctomycetota bacterium]|nr:serine/threonine-protein kinase [Planctomycetota bacterium]
MDATFEQVFLALAVRKGWIAKENAVQLLTGFRGEQGKNPELSLGDYLTGRKILNRDQILELVQGTRQYVSQAAAKVQEPAEAAAKPASDEKPAPTGPVEIVPGYRITGKLGVGGTATIFKAAPVAGGPEVALKILHPKKASDARQRERFLREAELLKRFRHPHLVEGKAFGVHKNLHYAVMELVNGSSVQDIIDKEKFIAERRALEILEQVAEALEYMHSQGYVHKDVKPGNIMISGESDVKLCDLGFAQAIETGGDESRESKDESEAEGEDDDEYTAGTVQFMSPEQAQGQRDVDIRSDIYSLGATLFYMVLGQLPFQGENDMDTMAKHVLEELDSAEMKNRKISPHMHYFIERMMSKDKSLRYDTPAALVKDIKEQLEGFARISQIQKAPKPPTPAPRPPTTSIGKKVPIGPSKPPPPESLRHSRLSRYTDKYRKKDDRRR